VRFRPPDAFPWVNPNDNESRGAAGPAGETGGPLPVDDRNGAGAAVRTQSRTDTALSPRGTARVSLAFLPLNKPHVIPIRCPMPKAEQAPFL